MPIYAEGRVPEGAAWLIELRELALANDDGVGIEMLGGELEKTGEELTLEHLPRSAARARVYYRSRRTHR